MDLNLQLEDNTTCSLYNGTTCTSYLQQYTNCLGSTNNHGVNILGSLEQQKKKEGTVITLFNFQPVLGVGPECSQILEPFVCLYFFHLCDDGNVIRLSKKQCTNIRVVCDKELKIIESTPSIASFIPVNVSEILSSCASNSTLDSKNCSELLPLDQ